MRKFHVYRYIHDSLDSNIFYDLIILIKYLVKLKNNYHIYIRREKILALNGNLNSKILIEFFLEDIKILNLCFDEKNTFIFSKYQDILFYEYTNEIILKLINGKI